MMPFRDTLRRVSLIRYRRVLAVRAARNALLLGILLRVPIFAGWLVLTLHVVTSLGRNYGQAGLVTAAGTICVAISGPWRGRLLDRVGLRQVVAPSVLVSGGCWAIAPFLGYWPLLALASLAGLFVVPTFSIIRQAVITAVPEGDRRTALALDSVAVELSFMIGPALGVWAASTWNTDWVLFAVEMCGVIAGAALWLANPPITAGPTAGEQRDRTRVPRQEWFTPRFLAVCAVAAAATIVLSGTDISLVAALRDFHTSTLIGPVLAIWGLGSLVGGLVYGGLRRPIPAFGLLGLLSVATLPLAFAPSTWPLAAISFAAGLICAPTITATLDQLAHVVPERARGEAIGWHGSAMTTGSALGAPLAGAAIDTWGHASGFTTVALFGLTIATLGALTTNTRRRRSAAEGSDLIPAHAAP